MISLRIDFVEFAYSSWIKTKSSLHLDFIHKQTLVIYIILSDSTMTFSSLWALKFLSRFIGYAELLNKSPMKDEKLSLRFAPAVQCYGHRFH